MQNEKTRVFIRDARKKGFVIVGQEGSHMKFERGTESFSVPATKAEISGPLAARLRRTYHF